MSEESNEISTANEIDNEQTRTLGQSIVRATIGLAIFAVVTAGLIAITQVGTSERIAKQIREARSKALYEIVPADSHNNSMLDDAFQIAAKELGLTDIEDAFIAKQDGKAISLILPVVAKEGYSGPIRLILGLSPDGQIQGVRVIEHSETPGLGDKIEARKSDWIKTFEGRSLDNTASAQWAVKKDGGDFDQLTGATITPRAIVAAIHEALLFYQTQQGKLNDTAPGTLFVPAIEE